MDMKMVKVISSAPGKLILFGEHASSRGKPAIVFAVNQRLEV
ncbi:MAG: mevalonate kinase, partial [Candidatus Gerdarchaeota archaeon]